jgi:type II secretory pathway pseudopilin PulG
MKAVSYKSTRVSHNRRGAVLIIAIICAVLVTLMLGTMVKITLTRAQQARHRERALQADWLAEAGLERAQAMLTSQPGYTGETWAIETETLGGPYSGVVTITIEAVPENTNARNVRIQADYPAGQTERIRKSKQVEIILTTGPSVETQETE